MNMLDSLVYDYSCRFEDGRIVGLERDGAAEQAGVRAGWVTNLLFTFWNLELRFTHFESQLMLGVGDQEFDPFMSDPEIATAVKVSNLFISFDVAHVPYSCLHILEPG